MDRDDMVDTGATVATAAGIRQARRKVYRKIYRTLYAGVPKRVGPIVALGSILSRFTKTAAPYDYTQIGYEEVMPSMISKEYYEKTAGIGSNLMNFVRGMRSRYNAAKAVKSVAKNNLEANLSRQNMLSKSIKRDYADLEALKNPAMRRNLGAGYDMYAKKNIDTLATRTYSNAAELNKLRSEQAGLQARVKETSSPLYAFKAALGRNKTAAALAPIRKIHKGVLRDMLDYKRMATAGWEKQVARNNIRDIIGGIRAGEAAQRASKAMPTATNYKAMMDASGIRNMDSTLYKKLRHRYGNI